MTEKSPNASKFTNLEPNIAAALSYIITPLTGIAFFLIEKEDKFVRFHALQSILFGFAFIIVQSIATSLIFVFLGLILAPLVSIAGFALYAFLMWKAYNNEMFGLPILGKIAKEKTQ